MICYHTITPECNDVADGQAVPSEVCGTLQVEDPEGVLRVIDGGMVGERASVDQIVVIPRGLHAELLQAV